jgi:signal transduction histidine kinase
MIEETPAVPAFGVFKSSIINHKSEIPELTVPGKAVGRAAVELPWLCPNTDGLVALAEAPASVPGLSAADPALAVFLLRFAQAAPEPDPFGFAPGALLSALLPETAAAYLAATTAGVLPTGSVTLGRVRAVADHAAAIAARIAEATRAVPAEAAAAVARLAPLGWYAVAAVDPFDAADPLADPQFPIAPANVQADAWGLDHAAITRRLAARWRLPNWVGTTIGCLTLPLRVARQLVPHPGLFAVVQVAVTVAEGRGADLGLARGADRSELLDHLGLTEARVDEHAAVPEPQRQPGSSGLPQDPHRVPLVRNLLRVAAESRRRNGPALVARLEDQIDQLHRLAAELGDQAGDRLRDAKLAALAELAAGAGHEINNPLAVISGNAQRLLRTEPDPDRGEVLRAVVRQTQRIAGILRDLMHFARPPKPESRAFPVVELIHAVRDDLAPLAAERGTRLELDGVPAGVFLEGDPKQLRHALAAVVRNAIEAAGADGWARVSCDDEDGCDVAIVVEDSGPGLADEVAEHAFDPFYSGRSAGRGRGLGLPTAWQLVRQNGGDLRHDPSAEGHTRFVLTARRAVGHEILSLRSA